MANRGPPNGAQTVDNTTTAFKHASISDQRITTPSPPIPTTGRRPKPGLKLSSIFGDSAVVGGGAAGAGLGAGRPSLVVDALTQKRPPHNFGTPFANFHKIVYAPI
jgi:mitogen-activated protein kinase kinase